MKTLIVGAHLDDIEIAIGGSIKKMINNNHDVQVVILSESDYINSHNKLQRTKDTAISEGLNALQSLGLKTQNIKILNFPTKDIPWHSTVIQQLDLIIEEYNPDLIFTHHPFDTNQSHVGTSQSVISAARRKNNIYFFEPIAPSGRSYVPFKPELYIDISNTIEDKKSAIRMHQSEYKKYGEEKWIEGITMRAGYRGYDIGVQYAEAFEVLRQEFSFEQNFQL